MFVLRDLRWPGLQPSPSWLWFNFFFLSWFCLSRCWTAGSWTRSLWGTRHRGLDFPVNSGVQPVQACLKILCLFHQDMFCWSAWLWKVLEKRNSFRLSLHPGARIREGIRAFIESCRAAGRSEKSAHFLYVNGFDPRRSRVPVQEHLKRGASLSRLTDVWLSTWGNDG